MSADITKIKQVLKKHGPMIGLIILGFIAIFVVSYVFNPESDSEAGAGIITVFSQKRNSMSFIGDRSTMLYYPNKPAYSNKIKKMNKVFFDTERDAKQYGFIRSF